MAEETVDAKLDSGDDTLQYFRTMLDIAAVVTPDIRWPDWQDYFCRHYDRERGTDLAALRGDAAMLRAEAQTARQTVIDQTAIKGDVQRGWTDSAGQVAVSTIEAYLQAAGQVAGVLEKTATAAEGVADAVAGAVDKKVQRMTAEFDSAAAKYIWTWVKTAVTAVLEQKVRKRFIEQLSNDIRAFDSIINDATTAIEAAYAKVPDAANGLNVMPTFPTPAFGEIGATDSPGKAPGTTSPGSGTNSPGSGGGYTGGSTGGGGGATGGSTAGKTGVTTGTTGATLPTSAMPAASTAGTSPASTTPASATPSTGNPLSGLTGSTGGAGMPSWLSQLVPKIAEQLGLGKDDDKTDGKDSKDGKDGKDDAKSKDGTTSETKDAQGRTVTATLSPDGRTVEVTVTKPDGTEEKATLTVGDDGKLTLDDPAGTSADTKPAGATPSGNTPGAGSAGTGGTGTTPGGSTGGTSPAGTTPGGTAPGGGGAPGASTASATPSAPSGNESPAAPAAAAPAPAPAPKSGAPQPAPAVEEPCPPQPQGSGAELAVTVP